MRKPVWQFDKLNLKKNIYIFKIKIIKKTKFKRQNQIKISCLKTKDTF